MTANIKNILIITAHPDDELLSCGGFILQESAKGHTINVCCVTDKGRWWNDRFIKSCDMLGAKHYTNLLIPLWDDKPTRTIHMFDEAEFHSALIKSSVFGNRPYDMVLTHGFDGDIDNHKHHKLIAKHLHNIFTKSKYRADIPKVTRFVGFPRVGLRDNHPLYQWSEDRKRWVRHLEAGYVPMELSERSYTYRLSTDTKKLKQSMAKGLYNLLDNYYCVNYPMELFTI